ncbi:MAG TPA: glycosyltransferase [bacterium]|nr:glycosyltransferase [bacterium]HPN31163.1 glycosyltransferase [bacterium]
MKIISEPLKIIFIINGADAGGAELILYHILKNIDKTKFLPVVIALKQNGIIADKIIKEGIQVSNLHCSGIFDIIFFFKLYKFIKNFHPDIISSFMFHSDMLARIIGKIAGCKVISNFHNIYIGNNFIDTKFRELLIRFTDCAADSCVIVSQTAADYFLRKNIAKKNKLNVILNGVDSEFYKNIFSENDILSFKQKNMNSNNEFIFIAAGRFVKYKGFDFLIKAARILKNKGYKFKLVIAGSGKLFSELKRFSENLNLNDYIAFPGNVDNLNEWLWCSDVFVMPSLWEGFPCVLLEAAASGLPIIATNVGGNSEIVEDGFNGFLIEPKNASCLAEKMENIILLQSHKRKELGLNGQTRINKYFQTSDMTKKYYDLFLKISEKN